MAKKSVELRQKKKAIYDEAQKLHVDITDGKIELSSEVRSKWDKMNADMEDLDSQIKTIEAMEARAAKEAAAALGEGRTDPLSGKPNGAEERSYDDQFMEVLRNGFKDEEVRSLNSNYRLGVHHKVEKRGTDPQSASTSALGGLLVPTTWAASIEKEMQAYGEVLGAVNTFTTTGGGTINFPYSSDFSKGAIIAENTAAVVQDVNWATKAIGAYKYTSNQIVVPYELFQDAAYDVGAEVSSKTAERIGRILAEHVTTGDGSSKPTGILTAAAASGQTTTGAAITTTLITELEHSVNRAHRNKATARFMMHDSTLKAIKLLSIGSSDDRPLWRISVREGEPDTINGYGYVVNDEMPELSGSVGDKVMAFGDFSKYRLRQVGGYRLMRLNELGALSDNTIFIAYARFDGNLIISNAIKTLAKGA